MFRMGAKLSYNWLKQTGQKLPSFRSFFGRQLRMVRLHYFWSSITGREFNSLDLIRSACKRMRLTLSEEQLQQLSWLWYEPLANQATIEAGLAGMLEGLRRKGYKLGLISNTFVPGEVLDKHLQREGLFEFFPARVYSCDVFVRKPNPAIFRLALNALSVPPEQVVFVGDTLVADVAGANRMGMISVLKDPTGKRTSRRIQPAYRIRSILELPAVLAKCDSGYGQSC